MPDYYEEFKTILEEFAIVQPNEDGEWEIDNINDLADKLNDALYKDGDD